MGHFNNDGPLDLAVTNGLSFTVSILLGDGLGLFSPAPGSPISVGRQPVAIAGADFNADGNLDLAVVDANVANVTILLGNGQGEFTPATGSPIAVGIGPAGVHVGDFTNDGKLDLPVSNSFSNNLMILLGNGQGQFEQASGSPIAVDSPAGFVVSDLNGDGQLDIATTSNNAMVILLGDGQGRFTEASGSPVAVGNSAVDVAVAISPTTGRSIWRWPASGPTP